MKVFITGGSGFVGTGLSRILLTGGHEVTVLTRSKKKAAALQPGLSAVTGDPTRPGKWQEAVPGHDLLINLAGASIFKRWTEPYKQMVRDSRILTTRNLVDAITEGSAVTLLSTSAVGYYGFTGDEDLDEGSPAGKDFLAVLARDWEAEAEKARDKRTRVVTTRFGVVLGKGGGALSQMTLPFKLFAGGPLGRGEQWFSWIHLEDLCRAAAFVASHREIEGPVNFTAPGPLRNKDLARAIGRALKRPSFMPAPGFMISLIMGEFGSVILKGQKVLPKVLLEKGFSFNYPDIDAALKNILA